MAYSAANQKKWDEFKNIVIPAWTSNSFTGLAALSQVLGSDWAATVPEQDRRSAHKMIAHAAARLGTLTGYRDPEANYYL